MLVEIIPCKLSSLSLFLVQPDNVLICDIDATVKLCDFGFRSAAAHLDAERPHSLYFCYSRELLANSFHVARPRDRYSSTS